MSCDRGKLLAARDATVYCDRDRAIPFLQPKSIQSIYTPHSNLKLRRALSIPLTINSPWHPGQFLDIEMSETTFNHFLQ